MAIRFGPQIEAELDEIWFYIAQESGSIDIADRLVDSISDHFFLLSKHPQLAACVIMICVPACAVCRLAGMSSFTALRIAMF